MKRLKFIILITVFLFGNNLFAQTVNKRIPDGNYYIVRHAEKDTGNDPVLTMAGYLRAGDLYRKLKDKKITKIYTNQYRRIQLTADSLRIYQRIDTVKYVVDLTGEDLLNRLTNQPGNQNVLIIGHSNTVPVIIKRLGITDFVPNELPDYEHDNLFVVTVKNNKAVLKKLKYGKASVPVASTGTMKN